MFAKLAQKSQTVYNARRWIIIYYNAKNAQKIILLSELMNKICVLPVWKTNTLMNL